MPTCEVCEIATTPLMAGLCPPCAQRLETHRTALTELETAYSAALADWRRRWAGVPDVMLDAPTLAYSAGVTVSEALASTR